MGYFPRRVPLRRRKLKRLVSLKPPHDDHGNIIQAYHKGPYFLAEDIAYPPVFQAIGTEDEAFDASQVTTFDDQLKKFRVDRMTMIFEGKHHSFDMKSLIGDEVHLSVMSPAADFVERYARKRGRDDQEYSS